MIEITLLGPMSVAGATRLTASDLGGAKPRQLLALLALDLGRPVHKDALAERMWDQQPPSGYITTLESYVCLLRRRLSVPAGRHCAIATSSGGYLLNPEHVRVDLAEVVRLLQGDVASVLGAVDRIGGDLLADEPYSAWAEEARTAFADVVAKACTRAARDANRSGDHGAAERLAERAWASAPFSEPALRELMCALVALGRRTEAVRAYADMRSRLAGELGLDVDGETRALFVRTVQGGGTGGDLDRAEASVLVQLLRNALAHNPSSLVGIPGSTELVRALRGLSAAC